MPILFQVQAVTDTLTNPISGNISWLLVGVGLFIAAIVVLFFLKNIIVNTVLGLIGWGILTYILQIHLPFWPSLVVSAVFGLAGLGAMVILTVLGIVI
jgi:hypothetical protein